MVCKQVTHRIMAAALALALCASAAHAQINPFRGRHNPGLGQADMALLSDAARQLNEAESVHVGDTKDWGGSGTGNAGTVTITRLFRSGSLACHALRYDVSFKAPRTARRYDVNWCKTSAGWKIKS